MFRRWTKTGRLEQNQLNAVEITVHAVPESKQLTVIVAGRLTVDSSPSLRSSLIELLRRNAASVIAIDVSAVSYMDMSGIATLLEALKAAREGSVKLHLAGLSGQSKNLAEVAQLDTIFRSWGSEVEFR